MAHGGECREPVVIGENGGLEGASRQRQEVSNWKAELVERGDSAALESLIPQLRLCQALGLRTQAMKLAGMTCGDSC